MLNKSLAIDFPKIYESNKIEQKWQQFWEKEEIYRFNPESGKAIFSVDTPPPYVSSERLHVGHAMSYSQAEFIIRYKRMNGFNIFYPMGFDDNGLPTERYVEKKYNVNKSKIQRQEFIDLCLKETKIGAEIYKKHWKELGISVDWSLTYSTIDPSSRKTAQLSFIELYNKGLIERRNDPIQWCVSCQTAVAQAEISIEEVESVLYDIKFFSENEELLIISTTRPELLPACVALYANPDDSRYKHLENKKAKVPLFDYEVPIKFDSSVDPKFGTGLMMVCTFGDIEDVIKWRKDNLETRIILDDKGILNYRAKQYIGIKLSLARQYILEELSKKELVIKSTYIKHNVGLHDRCSNPIEFNLKRQWFIKILNFKDQFLLRGEQLKWHPEFMKVRYIEWVSNLKWDWNISRQRYYGVPFPVWYCKTCDYPIMAKINDLPVDPLTDKPKINNCPKCNNDDFIQETDVMDTWMTSSLTPLINAKWAYQNSLQEKIYPMSLRPQAFEIIRTWLFYTIAKSHFHTNSVPWENVMISGWGLDKNGKKMSKSLGNFVAPEEVIKKYSADSLRYWSAGATLGHDLRYNEEDVKNGKRLLIKLWNAARYLYQNLEDFYPGQQIQRSTIDKWMLSKLQDVISNTTDFFENYEYSHALKASERFFWDIYCDNYLEIIKDRFWNPENYSSEAIISGKDTMYSVFLTILKLFAPFLPHITEELYDIIYKKYEKTKSIHVSSWPKVDVKLIDKKEESHGELLLIILKNVRKCKTNLKLHQNHWISELVIKSSDNIQQEILQITNDLKSAARAKRISFNKEATFQTENSNIKIDVAL